MDQNICPPQTQARATPLAPGQWRQMLADAQHIAPSLQQSSGTHSQEDAHSRPDSRAVSSSDSHASGTTAGAARPDVVVLDVRNDYEWDAGHFQGANRPQEVCHQHQPQLEIWQLHLPGCPAACIPDDGGNTAMCSSAQVSEHQPCSLYKVLKR